jgi:hypothetical protein
MEAMFDVLRLWLGMLVDALFAMFRAWGWSDA